MHHMWLRAAGFQTAFLHNKAAQGDRLYAMNPAMQGARANAAASEAIKTAAGNEAGSMAQ